MIDFFNRSCYEIFKFLEQDFNFKVIDIKRDRHFGMDIIYKNKTTAIQISFEFRECKVFISLYRLINGNLPQYKSLREYDCDFDNRFGFDDLITLRAPSLQIKQVFNPKFSEMDLELVLLKYANALRICAADVLKGDFQVFTELAKIKARRIENFRQKETKTRATGNDSHCCISKCNSGNGTSTKN